MKTRLFAAAALGLGLVTAATAHGGEDDKAINYRQSVFTVIKWNFAPMGAMVKGKIPFDQAKFEQNANDLKALAGMPLEGFAKQGDPNKTHAKAAIWDEWDTFKKGMEKFESEAGKLAEVAASGDRDAIRAQFAATAKTCKACHDEYKED